MLNDLMRAPTNVPVAKKLITAAAGEQIFELDGANSNGVPLVPARAITFGTRGGADMKVATVAGGVASGNYYTVPGGSKHTMQHVRIKQVYIAVTTDDTVEAIPL